MVTVCPSQFATRRTLFHVLVGCGLLMLKVSRLKLPVIWLLVSMWLNTLDRKSGSAGMPRPMSYAVFCLKKKSKTGFLGLFSYPFTRYHRIDLRPGYERRDFSFPLVVILNTH